MIDKYKEQRIENKFIGICASLNGCYFYVVKTGYPISPLELKSRFSQSTIDSLCIAISESTLIDYACIHTSVYIRIIRLLQLQIKQTQT